MKKLIVLALLIVGSTILAQGKGKNPQQNNKEQFSPEQQNQLKLKKMTLDLDLTDAQQKELSPIIAQNTAKKEAMKAERQAMKEKGTQPTADERFAREMKKLDDQIAFKKSMQKILTEKQFDRWSQQQAERQKDKKKGSKGGKKGDQKGGPKGDNNQERKG